MTPGQIAFVKPAVRAFSTREAEDLTRRALALGSEVEVRQLLRDVIPERSGLDVDEVEISGGI